MWSVQLLLCMHFCSYAPNLTFSPASLLNSVAVFKLEYLYYPCAQTFQKLWEQEQSKRNTFSDLQFPCILVSLTHLPKKVLLVSIVPLSISPLPAFSPLLQRKEQLSPILIFTIIRYIKWFPNLCFQ